MTGDSSESFTVPDRIPITVLTGFLGAGKTTLLSRLLREPDTSGIAVIVNELGQVGLDHILLAQADGRPVVMEGGCLCCALIDDLAGTVRDLYLRALHGQGPAFQRLVVETTGLADPGPVLHTLMTDPLLATRFRLDGVVTVVDAVHGAAQLDRHRESRHQAAVADRLVFSKTDLADPDDFSALRRRLNAINPTAVRIDAAQCTRLADALLDAGLFNPQTGKLDGQRWLRADVYSGGQGTDDHAGCDHDHGQCDHAHVHGGIQSFCLSADPPLEWERLVLFLEELTAQYGDDLLRVKGILHLTGSDQPIAIHGVQHLFHPPATLPDWPADQVPTTRIVLIGDGLPRQLIEARFNQLVCGNPL